MTRPPVLIASLAALVLIAAAFIAVRGQGPEDARAAGVWGDADCSSSITTADGLLVLKIAGGLSDSPTCFADTDCSGALDPADALRIFAHLANITLPAVPGCPPVGSSTGGETPSQSPPAAPTKTPTSTPTATPQPTANFTPSPTVSNPADCAVFPADNWWNTDVSTFPVHDNSDAIIQSVGDDTYLHPDFGTVWENKPIGIPYVLVDSGQPKVPVSFYYPNESDVGPYPIPPDVPVEGQPVGQPNTAGFGGDRHVLVLDEDACVLYEVYDAHPVNGGASWTARSGAIFDLASNDLRPDTWTSADAAGLPIFAGLVRYDEVVEQGVINHALRFTVSETRRAFIHPATHYASDLTSLDLPAMGERFRMKASYDCSWATSEVQVICAALKKYGMFVADNGADWYISGAPDPRWDDDRLGDLKDIPGSAFEVIDTGEPVITP